MCLWVHSQTFPLEPPHSAGQSRGRQSLKPWEREERNLEGISQPHPPNICLLSSPLSPNLGVKAKQTPALGCPKG